MSVVITVFGWFSWAAIRSPSLTRRKTPKLLPHSWQKVPFRCCLLLFEMFLALFPHHLMLLYLESLIDHELHRMTLTHFNTLSFSFHLKSAMLRQEELVCMKIRLTRVTEHRICVNTCVFIYIYIHSYMKKYVNHLQSL